MSSAISDKIVSVKESYNFHKLFYTKCNTLFSFQLLVLEINQEMQRPVFNCITLLFIVFVKLDVNKY